MNYTRTMNYLWIILALCLAPLAAQEMPPVAPSPSSTEAPSAAKPEKKEDAGKYDLKVSGLLYLQWYQDVTNPTDSTESLGNSFQVTRAYITLDKQFNDIFSARLTGDFVELFGDFSGTVDTSDAGEAEDDVDVTKSKYYYSGWLKNAFLQARYAFVEDFVTTLQVGLIGTPVMAAIDKQSGYRWISANYIDGSKYLLGNKDFGSGSDNSLNDNSADLGASLAFDVMKMVTLTYAVTNGEGFKDVKEAKKNRGKAQYGVITVSPVKWLFLNGFLRHEFEETDDNKNTDDKQCIYYGSGAGVDLMGIKLGGYYVYGTHETNGSRDRKAKLVDLYLNASLKEMIGYPVLVYGRFAWGRDYKFSAVAGKHSEAYVWAAGLGYDFHKNIRAGVYYEDYTIDYATNDHNRTFYVKSEIKL